MLDTRGTISTGWPGRRPSKISARLRFRINSGKLIFYYKLDRPTEVLQEAFEKAAIALDQRLGHMNEFRDALSDMVAQPRAATVMGLLEEARLGRMRGYKVSQKAGSMHNAFGRVKDWLVGNF